MAKEGSLWRLRFDLWWAQALIWVTRAPWVREGELQPGIHLYLSDLYGRLAKCYSSRGNMVKALSFDRKAAWHYQAAGPDTPPRAAAAVMPIPEPPLFTDARANDARSPDDAA